MVLGSPAASSSPTARQFRLEALDENKVGAVGAISSRTGTADVAAAFVVEGALRRGDLVVTSHPDELGIIAASAGSWLEVDRP